MLPSCNQQLQDRLHVLSWISHEYNTVPLSIPAEVAHEALLAGVEFQTQLDKGAYI